MPSTPTEAKTLTLTALIESLENADGPSEQLDVLIENATGTAKFKREHDGIGDFDHVRADVKPLTASIDAAVALATRLLPGWSWTVYSACGPHGPRSVLVNPDRREQVGQSAASPALSLCAATLRALSAQEGSTDA